MTASPASVARRLRGLSISLIRQMYENAPPGAINLGLGEPTFETAPEIVAVAHAALDAGRLGYTFNGGLPELRAAIASQTPGTWTADSVCVTVGAAGGLMGSFLASVDAGDEVLVPDPGFPAYATITSMLGARPVRYPLSPARDFRFTADLLEPLINDRSKAVVINSPSNPTGQQIPLDQLERVADLAAAHGLMVISDEVYREFFFDTRPVSFAEVSERGMVVYSLSKVEAMTGWRLGWVVGPPEMIAAVTIVNQCAATCAPALSQRAALRALEPDAAARADKLREDFTRRRRLMIEAIESKLGLPYVAPDGAFFVMVEAARRGNSLEVALDVLAKTAVITVPGAAFGKEADRFLRLSFAASEADIATAFDRLADYPF